MKEKICCVYCIENKVNNKKYIGSTIDFNFRTSVHVSLLNSNKHHSKHLQNAWNKYGQTSFNIFIVEQLKDKNKDEIIRREQYWLDFYQSYNGDKGYNINKLAISCLGRKWTKESKDKLSKIKKGCKLSEETKLKISKTNTGSGNGFYNKKHTEETKEKIRESKIGKKITESQLYGLSLGRGSKCFTEETYKKLREKNSGEKSGTSKLKEIDVIDILTMIKNKVAYKEISEKYNISVAQISRIKSGLRWGYLKEIRSDLYE